MGRAKERGRKKMFSDEWYGSGKQRYNSGDDAIIIINYIPVIRQLQKRKTPIIFFLSKRHKMVKRDNYKKKLTTHKRNFLLDCIFSSYNCRLLFISILNHHVPFFCWHCLLFLFIIFCRKPQNGNELDIAQTKKKKMYVTIRKCKYSLLSIHRHTQRVRYVWCS